MSFPFLYVLKLVWRERGVREMKDISRQRTVGGRQRLARYWASIAHELSTATSGIERERVRV